MDVTSTPRVVRVHGVVRVVITAAEPHDLRTVERQIGPASVACAEDLIAPDVEVRFVDRLSIAGRLIHVGHGEAAFDDCSFYVTKAKGQVPVRVRLPLETAGSSCVVECERGLPAVPLLVALVNIAALAHGVLPLHGSVVQHQGRSLLATGWSKGGKTETVLALERLGAWYVSDEWTYLTRDEHGAVRATGLPEPVRVWAWQLAQLPALRDRVLSSRDRQALTLLSATAKALERVGAGPGTIPGFARRIAPVVARQAYSQIPPAALFDGRCLTQPVVLDEVLLVQSWFSDQVELASVPGGEVASRMRHSLAHERLPLTMLYQQFRFAFPDRRSPVIDDAEHIEALLLDRVFGDRAAYTLRHPYPVDLDRIADALAPLLPAAEPRATA